MTYGLDISKFGGHDELSVNRKTNLGQYNGGFFWDVWWVSHDLAREQEFK